MDAPASSPHLTLSKLGLRRNERWLFRNLSWELPRGKVIAVVGGSGSGKSSLLACLAGLLEPSEGTLGYRCHRDCAHTSALRLRSSLRWACRLSRRTFRP